MLKDYEYLTVREHRAKHEPENQTHRTDLLMSCGRRVHLRHITSVCYRNTAEWPTHFQQGETPKCVSQKLIYDLQLFILIACQTNTHDAVITAERHLVFTYLVTC